MEARLPTEAEWEYACRAGTTTIYSFGDDEEKLSDYAWYRESRKHPVAQKKPNRWGLYDTYGKVWEFCADWYGPNYYAQSPLEDPQGPSSGRERVLRGGSGGEQLWDFRSANREEYYSSSTLGDRGFRVVLLPD